MVITDLDIRRRLAQAATAGKYLIMISHVDQKKKTVENFYKTVNFPRDDIPNALNKMAEMLDAEVAKSAEGNS